MKRPRSEELVAEFERQVASLNRSFKQFIHTNKEGNPAATWEEGCKDYLTHAEQLQGKFCVEGSASSFGSGDCGQLGHGVDDPDKDLQAERPRRIDTLKDVSISALACGGMHNLVVDAADGSVWSWGCSDDHCLGRTGDENYPTPIPTLQHKVFVLAVSAGDSHSVALTMTGQIYVWGAFKDKDGRNWFPAASSDGAYGQPQATPMLLKNCEAMQAHGGATQIASGGNHAVALCGDGSVYSWGIGEIGQLGRKVCELKDGEGVYRKDQVWREHLTPARMVYASGNQEVDNARSIGVGSYHTFVIQAVRSRVFACGLNQYCQTAMPESAGTQIELLQSVAALDDLGIASVHGGEHYSMAISHDGHVYTFGRADSNQLGVAVSDMKDEAGAFTSVPQLVKFDPPAAIAGGSCGTFHCTAVSRSGDLFTWGFGEMGQLGSGKSEDEKVPYRVLERKGGAPIKVAAVAAGGQHTVVVLR